MVESLQEIFRPVELFLMNELFDEMNGIGELHNLESIIRTKWYRNLRQLQFE